MRAVIATVALALSPVLVFELLARDQDRLWHQLRRGAGENHVVQGFVVDPKANALHDRILFSHGRRYVFSAGIDAATNVQRSASVFVGTRVMQKADRTCEKSVTTLVATQTVGTGADEQRLQLPVTATVKSDVDCPV